MVNLVKITEKVEPGVDYVFAIDLSGSMNSRLGWRGPTRYSHAAQIGAKLSAEAAVYDHDGIDLALVNGDLLAFEGQTPEIIRQTLNAYRPYGGTRIELATDWAWELYLTRREAAEAEGKTPKRMRVILIIDGQTRDPEALKASLVRAANGIGSLDGKKEREADYGFSFLILKVGNDKDADELLQILDEGLVTEYDIVGLGDAEQFEITH